MYNIKVLKGLNMFNNDIDILDLLFKIMPFVFWKGRDGCYLGGNDNQAHAFGFSSPDEFVGKTIFEILPDQNSAKKIDEIDNRIMQSGKSLINEEIITTPAGERIYHSQKHPISDKNGNVIGLLGFAIDITELKTQDKLAKEERKKITEITNSISTKVLTLDRIEILEELFNMMPYIFWKDRDGIYCGANSNQLKAFGFSSSKGFIGKPVFEVLKDQESAKKIDEVDNKIMSDGSSITIEESMLTPHGEKIYLSQKSSLFDKYGKVVGLLGFAMDITQIREKEKLAKEKSEREQNRFQSFVEQLLHVINNYKITNLNHKLGKSPFDINDISIELTKREKEVLYFLAQNKSPKEIASILSILEEKDIAPKSVQAVIDKQLYPKFGVYSTGELIEKAHVYNLIPFLLR